VHAFHRWVPGQGHDVIVVVSLSETTLYDHSYALGIPFPGRLRERANSNYYDCLPNPWVQGNGGRIVADGPPMHGLGYSTRISIPANSILVFTRNLDDS
jgi:1,4-alpha-glucan branching enzyme